MNIIGSNSIVLNQIDSTNEYASNLLSNSKQIEGTIVLADFQTNGKGQGSNVWISGKGKNLLLSIILYPDFLDIEKQFFLSMAISMGIQKTVEYFVPGDCKIKWPNDIFVRGKKVAGVLIQNVLSGKKIKSTIVGIGLNVNQIDFPDNLQIASSLRKELGKEIKRDFVLEKLIEYLNYFYNKLMAGDLRGLKESYLMHLYLRDVDTEFELSNGVKLTGKIKGVSEIGKLIVYSHGEELSFFQKEIRII